MKYSYTEYNNTYEGDGWGFTRAFFGLGVGVGVGGKWAVFFFKLPQIIGKIDVLINQINMYIYVHVQLM